LLRKRGEIIGKEDYPALRDINDEIHKLVTTNDDFLDKI